MEFLSTFDYTIIIVYFVLLLGMGVALSRRAGKSVEDYFLAGRNMPWWALGVSGMTFYFDLAGTALIISFIFLLGPRGLFIEFRGGAGLILAIMMLWTGKWHRRSRAMTGAEWMGFRFGEGFGGQFARVVSAVAVIISTIGMLAYSIKATSIFFAMFLPYPPLVCALLVVAVTAIYTMLSGFYGVVYSNFFQGLVIVVAVGVVVVLAVLKVSDVQSLSLVAAQVTGNGGWTDSLPRWTTEMPAGYEMYKDLGLFTFFYLVKAVFQGMGWGDDPRYFGAKEERDCGTLTVLWTSLMTFRWPLIMSFAILGLYLVQDLFPDQTVLAQAAQCIKESVGPVDKNHWADLLSSLVHHPEEYSPALLEKLRQLLGTEWMTRLQLVGYEGTVNPERIMPAVLIYSIPAGLRGLIIIALLAAEMSTFSASVNRAGGYFTRDLYQRYLRPHASTRELITASWAALLGMTGLAILFVTTISSINDVWGWITMGLGSGLLLPAFLRFYWARFNGGGFAIGTTVGILAAVLQRIFLPHLDEWVVFLAVAGTGLLASVIGTYATTPTDPALLERFYRMTRPFGFWKELKARLDPDVRARMEREHRIDLLSLPIALVWQVSLYLLPMQLVIKAYATFWPTFAVFAACSLYLYVVWYRSLPAAGTTDDRLLPLPERTQ